MRRNTTLYTLAKVATTIVLFGGGFACEIARIAAPPADRVQWKVHGEGYAVVPSFDLPPNGPARPSRRNREPSRGCSL